MRTRRGFTLIEMMVTLAMLAFMVALALPSYRSYSVKWACRTAAQKLYMDLLYQQKKAFSTCLETGITIGPRGSYVKWEKYYTGAYNQAAPDTSLPHDPMHGLLSLALALIPAGCDPPTINSDSPATRYTTTVDLREELALPITFTEVVVKFVPTHTDSSDRWMYCNVLLNDVEIGCNVREILVTCGTETSVVIITELGDIIMN